MPIFTQQELDLNTLGDTIRKLRKARGLQQSDVAERVGVDASTVSQWERHKRAPSRDKLPMLMALLCASSEEEREFFHAYHGADAPNLDQPVPPVSSRSYTTAEPQDGLRVDFAKHFHNHLKGLLDEAGIRTTEHFAAPPKFTCDFLTTGKTKIAIFAKPIPNLDWDRTIGKIFLRPPSPEISAFVIVTPYRTRESEFASNQMHGYDNVSIALPDGMVSAVRRHGG